MQLPQPGPRDLRSPTALSALAVQVPLGPCESTTAAVAECHSTGWAARATGACSHTVPEPRAVIRSPEALGPSESSLLARRWASSLLVRARSSLRVRRLHPSLFLRGQSLNSGLPLRRFQLHHLLRGPVTDTVTSGSRFNIGLWGDPIQPVTDFLCCLRVPAQDPLTCVTWRGGLGEARPEA